MRGTMKLNTLEVVETRVGDRGDLPTFSIAKETLRKTAKIPKFPMIFTLRTKGTYLPRYPPPNKHHWFIYTASNVFAGILLQRKYGKVYTYCWPNVIGNTS